MARALGGGHAQVESKRRTLGNAARNASAWERTANPGGVRAAACAASGVRFPALPPAVQIVVGAIDSLWANIRNLRGSWQIDIIDAKVVAERAVVRNRVVLVQRAIPQ